MSNPLPSHLKKPEHLYHASVDRDIKEFEPRQRGFRDISEGKVVFGAYHKAHAACFLITADDTWISTGYLNDVPYILISDEARYRQLDLGGAIYELPSVTFDYDPERGTGWHEWTSKESVRPSTQTNYDSAIEAMLDLGVQVYFSDINTFKKFKAATGKTKFDIIAKLKSENQKQNHNIRQIN